MYWQYLITLILIHFFIYLCLLRSLRLFERERMILIYHLAFFFIVFIILSTDLLSNKINLLNYCGLLSLQTIYSLTFLELWSLSEGSYSLQILSYMAENPNRTKSEINNAMSAIGFEKKKKRLKNLFSIGLIKFNAQGEPIITFLGKIIATSFRLIKYLSNIKEAG